MERRCPEHQILCRPWWNCQCHSQASDYCVSQSVCRWSTHRRRPRCTTPVLPRWLRSELWPRYLLVGAVRGLLSDRERWLLDRAHGFIDDDSGCCVASLESTRCKHHAYQYTRSLTLPTRKADRTIFPWQQCYSPFSYVFMLFCLFLQVYTGWPIGYS